MSFLMSVVNLAFKPIAMSKVVRGSSQASQLFLLRNQQNLRFSTKASSCNDDDDDQPDPTVQNPYLKEKPQCILCRFQVELDYKNVRLLSQFVSPYTGKMYDKHITGLCETQHQALKKEITRAIKFGLMSPFYRDPKFADDPRLFDPTRPQRPNPY